MKIYLQIATAYIAAAFAFILGVLGMIPGFEKPSNEINLDKFNLVWADEFDGDTIDSTKWRSLQSDPNKALLRKGGYLHGDLAEVKDGNLHIYTKYFEDGLGGGKSGYYSHILYGKGLYEQKYGYFEVRCILPKGSGQWAAFWLNSQTMENVDGTGLDGAEIDVFESPNYHKKGLLHNYVSSNIHVDGYGEDLKSCKLGVYPAVNPYEEYNTYGVEWNEDEYIFYINGKETIRSSFAGTSQTPEYMILSVEVGGSNGKPDSNSWAGDMSENNSLPSDFVVDYVRAYQYKELCE